MQSKKVLIAVLNWGLGHATRCVPIIQQLQQAGYQTIIASDGSALDFLKKEFPACIFERLPSYDITYSKNPAFFGFHILRQFPKISRVIKAERKVVEKLVEKHQVNWVISDNRPGAKSDKVPSIYITHQLNVLSGITTYFSTKIHAWFYHKFDQIWVPDFARTPNLSGTLGHLKKENPKVRYIGALSRMKATNTTSDYDILAILSGPEPQRSIFESVLLQKLSELDKKILLIQGLVAPETKIRMHNNIKIINFVNTNELQKLINRSETIIARSGYTSVMDLFAMQKKVLWVPTPGQAEQMYLAKHLQNAFDASVVKQEDFYYKTPSKIYISQDTSGANIIDLIRNLNKE